MMPTLAQQLREPILQRLATTLSAVPGVASFWRDRGELKDVQRPAVVLLDGSEAIVSEVAPLKTVRMPPAIFVLRPQIVVIAKERDNPDNLTVRGQPAPIGPELTQWLELVHAVVLNDPGLFQLVTPNGQIIYLGHDTDMAWNSSFIGGVQMHFGFYYPFFPPPPPPNFTYPPLTLQRSELQGAKRQTHLPSRSYAT